MNTTLLLRWCCGTTALLLVGCAHHLRFHVVDGSSGISVPAVKVSVRKVTSFSYFRYPEKKEIGLTDTNGFIDISVSKKDNIYFDARGFHDAVAGLDKQGRVVIKPKSALFSGGSVSTNRIVVDRKKLVLIPLVPLKFDTPTNSSSVP
jgi:hypothetical protein